MSILEVHDVSIRYMTGDFKDIGLKEYVMRKLTGNYHVVEFWADRHISFSLEKGDMLGIVGTNGAGKSTLLKAVSGIMEPTGGYVKREGNIAALLELASGFDGDLTVRENAYLRGAMLGYTRKFMDEKYPEIIEFAELQDFQDRPFKQLSSGMMSRLAFSVASLVHPDILILDEVLSVGDGAFRKKSEAKMREIINSGATTILVSHSIEQVREMCNKVLWIEKGNQIGFGDTELLCDLYQGYLDGAITLDDAKARLETAGPCSAPTVTEPPYVAEISPAEPTSTQEQSAFPDPAMRINAKPTRIFSVDIAKAAAICAVLLIHCSANHFARFEVGSPSWLITNLFGSVGRWAVPLFLLCSGAIMNAPSKDIPLKKLFSQYLIRLFLFLIVSSVFYETVNVLKAWNTASLPELLMDVGKKLLYGNTHYHLYFFWFIFALYLTLPLTRLVSHFASEQELRYIILAFFLCGAVLPLLQYYPPVNQMHNSLLYFVLPAAFLCPGLGLIGWYMRIHPPKHWLSSLFLFLGGFTITFGGTWFRSYRSGTLDVLYLNVLSPFSIIMAIAVFRLCQYLAGHVHQRVQHAVEFLSSASFIIYLIHPFFQETLAPAWFLSSPVHIAIPLQWLMLMGLSLLTYLLINAFGKSMLIRCWAKKLSERAKNVRFLLTHQVDTSWSRGKKAAYYAYRMLFVSFAAFLMGLLLLDLAAGDIIGFKDYFLSWKIIALNTVPVMLLAILLYGITGRAWSGLFLGSGIATILSLANYYKLNFRNDPLRMEDLFLFREAANMVSSGYAPYVDERIVLTLAGLIGLTVSLYFATPGKLSQWKKRGAVIVIAMTALVVLIPIYRNQSVYESVKNPQANIYNPIENLVYRGFVYPFLYSVNDVIETSPPGYDERAAEELLHTYTDKDIPEDKKINVIAIMREAYTDFSRYDIPGLDTSVYDSYHELEKESYVGDMVSNTFAGGTINAERCFLSGNYQEPRNFRSNYNSYVWYLRQQGYTTEGSHPYFEWFYSRNVINGLLGFENYRFYENDYENLCSYLYFPDNILCSEIYNDFQKNKSTGKPYFSFSVTMQAHGPYPTDRDAPVEYLTGPYSEQCQNAVGWYLSHSGNSDQGLIKLINQLRFDPEPVVLLTFGDHMPWMGDNNVFYDEMGLDIQCSQEGSMYSTRYLIWANDAARDLLGHDIRGEGPTVSPCYLMNLLFQQLDWEGPAFLQAMNDMMEVFPVLHTLSPEHYVVDGIFTEEIPENRKELFNDFCYLQKYWRSNYLFEESTKENQSAVLQSLRHGMPQRMQFILHAGGVTPEGVVGSNSLEALDYSYEQGYRNMEMDFCWTGDRDLACVHDWGSYYGNEIGEGTIEQFNEIRSSRYGFTSMTLDHLAQWLEEHPDVRVITDIKEDNVEGVTLIAQRYPSLKDQFVIQIYHYNEYEPVALLGFKNIILTVYQMAWEEKTNKMGLEEFIRTHRLIGLTFPEILLEYPIYGDMTFVNDVPLYVHTVNDGELQKKYLDMGISGIYTDVGKAF